MRIHSPKMTNAEATGSFSGSFTGVGNFEGLTADSVAYDNVTGKPQLISGSEQVTISGTTGFSSYSASVESSISVEKGRVDAILNASSADKDSFKEIVDLINTVDTENDTAFAGYVTSSGNRLTALESSVSNLDNTYATDVALSNVSGALDTSIKSNAAAIASLDNDYATDAQLTTVSSSLKGEIADNKTAIANLDGNYATDAQLTSVSGALDTSIKSNASAIAGLDGTYATDASVNSLSGSAHTQRKAIESSLNGKINTEKARVTANASAIAGLDSTYATDVSLNNSIASLSGSAHTQREALDSEKSGEITSAVSALSGSAHSQRKTIEASASANTTKLAGIEDGATADQSASQILDAIKTVDGAGSGLDADKLDGQSSAFYATATSVSTHAARTDNPHSVTKSQVGLGNVTNESKSTLLNNPSLTGTVTAPTQLSNDDSTKVATTAFVQDRVDEVIGTAGAALDTLGELSASLASDQSGLASLTTTVGTKLAKASNLSDLANASTARGNLGLGSAAVQNSGAFATSVQGATADSAIQPDDLASVATSGAYGDLTGKPTTITTTQRDAIVNNTAKQTNVSTNLSATATGTSLTVNSSDGNNASIPAVTSTTWGAMTDEDKVHLDSIEAGATADQSATEILNALKTVDGAGSGLDADKLDGQSSSYFGTAANVSTNASNISTNTTKLAGIEDGATGDQTAGQILDALLTVDGSGSGLDADKLDGQSSAYFGTAAAVSTNTANIATNTGKLAGIEDGATADQSASQILDALKTVDGAGSGLDADKLDGNSSSHFGTAANVSTNTSNISANASAIGTINAKDPVLTITGDVSGTATFTNLGNATLTAVVADDSHNHTIANVDGLQSAINTKANLASPALTGNPTVPTQDGANSSTRIASTAFVQGRIDDIIGTAGSTLDTLGELSASLASDQSGLASLTTTVGTKLAKASNLSDLANAGTARTNLGVKTQAQTYTGVTGDIAITSAGVATIADDSHNHTIANVDGLQAALNAKQAAGTYNTVIGTDTDVDTSGATVIDNIYMTDGVITSHGTRTLTLANLGYTGATDANKITNNTQISNGRGYITSYVNTVDMGDGFKIANSAGTDQFTVTENEEIKFAGGGATSVAFDAATQKITISSTDTNTVYTHPGFNGDDFSIDTGALTGATVISDLDINVTTNSQGHVTDANGTVATRTLTLGDLGYTGATNANYITNNNQLTNGAGYQTSAGSVAYATSAGNAGTVDNKNASDFFNDGDTHLYMANGDGIVWDDTTNQMFVRKDGSDYELYSTDNLSLSTLGYTGATNANRITNNNQISNGAGYQTAAQVSTAVAAVVDSAPGTLDTLNELAAALGDDANFATTMTNALANKQAAGTYNTVIGTDTDVNTSGANIIDNIYMTDGVITSHGQRALTLGDLGYSGATNANYITNNNQLTNGASYLTTSGKAADSNLLDGLDLGGTRANAANKVVRTDSNGYTNFGWINTTSGNTTSTISDFYVNTNDGYIRKATPAHVRSQLNVANGATNVTNNNQLTNGAGYITSYTDTNTTYTAGRGLDLSGTEFRLETDLRDSISYLGYDSNDYIYWSNNSFQQFVVAGTERLRVDTAGIDVSGRIVADGDITAYSDERLKKDIKTIEGALDKTKALRGVEFTRIADDSKSIGVVAQELEEVLPELVLTDDEGMKSVNYAQITGLLIEAVKELSAKVDKLENK